MHLVIGLLILIFSMMILIRKFGVFEKKLNGNVLFMFTNLSISLCGLFYAVELFFVEESYVFSCLKFYLMIYMVIVMLVYNFILVPHARVTHNTEGIYSFYDCIAHIGLPLLVVIDYFSYTFHYKYSIISLFLSLLYPAIYCVMVFAKGYIKFGEEYRHSKNYYPYFFLDAETLGLKKVFRNIGFLLGVILMIGFVTLVINNHFLVVENTRFLSHFVTF